MPSPVIRSKKICPIGNLIRQAFNELNLILVNDKSHNTIETPFRTSAKHSKLYLAFASPSIHLLINDWPVLKDSIGNDHLPIFFFGIDLTFITQNNDYTSINFKNPTTNF